MKYRCLLLDHDDTVVDSTATIHYPCFLAYLDLHFPGRSAQYTLRSYFEKNFDPGILSLLRDEVGLSEREIAEEERFWHDYVEHHIPRAYDRMRELLVRFRSEGGIIAVSSHSYSHYIRRDYEHNRLPVPDVIFGWDMDPALRKPHPHSAEWVMRTYGLAPHEVLMVDDSKPGFDCARGAGIDFAAAGWAVDSERIRTFMTAHCDYYLPTVDALERLIFEDEA